MEKKLTNRDKQAIATKEKIYKTGMEMIKKHGFDGISVSRIAKSAGVSVGTFYHYYTSKLDLFMDLYRIADTYFENEVAAETAMMPFGEKIKTFFREYCSMAENNGVELTCKMYVPDNSLFLARSGGMRKVLMDIISVETGEHSGSCDAKTAEEICDDLFLIARGTIFDWALHGGKYDLKGKMDKMLDVYLDLT